jgi:hypothetical protein
MRGVLEDSTIVNSPAGLYPTSIYDPMMFDDDSSSSLSPRDDDAVSPSLICGSASEISVPYLCPVETCQREFSRRQEVVDHFSSDHESNELKIYCAVCGHGSDRMDAVERHVHDQEGRLPTYKRKLRRRENCATQYGVWGYRKALDVVEGTVFKARRDFFKHCSVAIDPFWTSSDDVGLRSESERRRGMHA